MSSEPPHAEQSRLFAKRVLEAFQAANLMTDPEVSAAGGPSDSYMTNLRHAAFDGAWVPPPRRNTQKSIEEAAGWAPGSAWAVWNGDEPTPVGAPRQDATVEAPAAKGYVSAPGPRVEGGASADAVLQAIGEMRAEMELIKQQIEEIKRTDP